MNAKALKKRIGIIALLYLFLLMLMPSNALALVSVEVRFPIVATGADCTVELLDNEENRRQALLLKDGEENAFTVSCYLMEDYYFTIRLIEKDTDSMTYDHTEYKVMISLFRNEDGEIGYVYTASDGHTTFKPNRFEFSNTPIVPPPTEVPRTYRFTFIKLWPGEHEDSITWVLYKPDGTVAHKKFNKKIVSANEWYYEAWFPDDVDYYLIESVPDGYTVRYENVGEHAGETDRCYNGGKIINYKIPKTGDQTNLPLWLCCILLGLAAVFAGIYTGRRKKAQQK